MENHWVFLRRTLKLLRPFWFGEEKRIAWGWLAVLILALFAINFINIKISYAERAIATALLSSDQSVFWSALLHYALIFVFALPVIGTFGWIKAKLVLAWRDWMTRRMLGGYYNDSYFHTVNSDPSVDNPDQRIQQDINIFCDKVLTIAIAVLDSTLAFAAFIAILWFINWKLVLVAVLYSAVGSFIMLRYGKRVVGMYANQEKLEADFRRGMIYSAEHSTSVASYQGSGRELKTALARFKHLVTHWNGVLSMQRNLQLFRTGYDYVVIIVPMLITVPLFFAGQTDVGAVFQAGSAFGRVLGALSIIIAQFQMYAELAASAQRLGSFSETLERYQNRGQPGPDEIHSRCQADHLNLDGVTVMTPDGERTLVRNLSVAIPAGSRLLITGRSGVGKSSLLRAIAGLWLKGSGNVARPDGKQSLFLPQKPYMPLGTLRDQITYPAEGNTVSDQELLKLLDQVGLSHLAQQDNALDSERNWANELSSGEQQRIAVARLLLAAPKLVLLDEATSALDAENERMVYETITARGITIVSVAHRDRLLKYHQQVLELKPGGDWQLFDAGEYKFPE